jgi:hypothetical protein
LGYKLDPIIICGDNQGSLFLAKNPQTEKRTKHVDIRYHYIRHCVDEGNIKLHNVSTNDQEADILTKNVTSDKIEYFRKKLGIWLSK